MHGLETWMGALLWVMANFWWLVGSAVAGCAVWLAVFMTREDGRGE